MPIIRVEMIAGRTLEQKKDLITSLTREASRVIGCDPKTVYVVIEDVKKENWGVGGVPVSETHPDL